MPMRFHSPFQRSARDEELPEDPVTDVPIRTDPVSIMASFRRFWPLTRGDRRWLVVIFLCAVLAALAETITVLLFAKLTDTALQSGDVSAFWKPASTSGSPWRSPVPWWGTWAVRSRSGPPSASCCGCGPASSAISRRSRRTSSSAIAAATWWSG